MIELEISTGKSRSDTNWKVEYLTWDELVKRLRRVRRTGETVAEYDRMTPQAKMRAKDGPAFVGGMIRGGRRLARNVESRSLITLDADHVSSLEDFLFDVDIALLGNAYVIYSTHSHRPTKPKLRLIVPVSRRMAPDEYGAVSRKIAEKIGITYFDKTTFQVNRLMYFPSCSKDAEPFFHEVVGEPLDVDAVLAEYDDWHDVMSWPRHPEEQKVLKRTTTQKVEDPRTKEGIIGIFCRTFSIEEGIERFLSDVYEPGTMPHRYSYVHGTSVNGLQVFPDQELVYSHQDSDPIADGRTYNLFDLVRVHKFGHLDEDVNPHTPDAKRPSHLAMERWVSELPEVKKQIIAERQAEYEVIAEGIESKEQEEAGEPDDESWIKELEIHPKTGKILPTSKNIELILSNGIWKGVLAYDDFGNTEVILKDLPWRKRKQPQYEYEPWLASDDKRLQHWFGVTYGIYSEKNIRNAFVEIAHRNEFHPIKNFIERQPWDGIPRAETVFIDYLGAEDSPYVRAVTRKMLLAAVTRLYQPGCKFDYMLVLVGPQGAGKSSLLAKLGQKWFSDSLKTFENKEAGEHLQRGWIFEISELAAMKKSEIEEVKAFLSKTEDRYRVAYDRVVSEFPRKCVFFGTTNTKEFLHDMTGNRRFWPVEVDPERRTKNHWTDMTEETVQQIWAEVLTWYRAGESLELDDATRAEALQRQEDHLDVDPREGLIREWLEEEETDEMGRPTGQKRQRVCAVQVLVECLGKRRNEITIWDARDVIAILRRIPGWRERKGKAKMPGYGAQRVFERLP